MSDYGMCPRCGRAMTWELDAYDDWVCWPCTEGRERPSEAWWETVAREYETREQAAQA